jgi:hypothetical protein
MFSMGMGMILFADSKPVDHRRIYVSAKGSGAGNAMRWRQARSAPRLPPLGRSQRHDRFRFQPQRQLMPAVPLACINSGAGQQWLEPSK